MGRKRIGCHRRDFLEVAFTVFLMKTRVRTVDVHVLLLIVCRMPENRLLGVIIYSKK
jgi:hypothetical protein